MPDVGTVGDLLDYLATQPRDRPVVVAKDGEGSSFSPLASGYEGMYVEASTWSGHIYSTPEQLAGDMRTQPEVWSEDDAAPDSAVRVVVLGPVN